MAFKRYGEIWCNMVYHLAEKCPKSTFFAHLVALWKWAGQGKKLSIKIFANST